MSLLKIKIELEGDQFRREANSIGDVAAKGSVSLDSLTAKAAGVSFAFNQISDTFNRVAAVAAVPIGKFIDLQDQMSKVESLGVPNIQSLTDSVLDMSGQISLPIDSLTGGLFEIVSAGVDAANQMDVLKVSALAAKAGISDTGEVFSLGSLVIKNYGKSWSDLEPILDRVFKTNELGKTTITELGSSAGQIVPQFAALKISTDELFGSLATLTGVTGNTSEVSTQLKAVASELLGPTKELTELVQKQGFESVEAAVASEGFVGILRILADATKGSGAELKKYFGSVEAINALLALTTTQFDTFVEKTDAMTNSSGSMRKALEAQEEKISSQITLLENRWERVMVKAVAVTVPFANSLLEVALKASDSRSEVEKLSDAVSDIKNEFKKNDELSDLLKRYDELKKKAKLSTDEHGELKKIIETLSGVYPTAITKIDEYGNAIEISAGKVRSLVEARRQLLLAREKEDIVDPAVTRMRDLIDLTSHAQDGLDEIKNRIRVIDAGGGLFVSDPNAAENVKNEIAEFQKRLSDANEDIDRGVFLLSNYFDFEGGASGELAKEMGLSQEQVEALTQRWQALGKAAEKANAKQAGKIEQTVSFKPGAAPDLPTVGLPDLPDAIPADEIINLASFDDALQIVNLKFDNMLSSEQEWFDQSIELLAGRADSAKTVYGEESVEYLESRREMLEFEADFQRQKEALQQQAFDLTIGQMASLVQTAQGSNKALFEIGKGAAFAEAIYNTYAGATAAFKALAPIPIVGPALGAAAAAAAIAGGLANAQKIAQTKFEKRRHGGFLGEGIRTIASGNFGDGEDRLIIANSNEFIVNANATRRHRDLLESINQGASLLPVRRHGGVVGSATSSSAGVAELNAFKNEVVRAIRDVNINLVNTMEGQQFLREEFPRFEKAENQRRF